jgi:hypothetical protein
VRDFHTYTGEVVEVRTVGRVGHHTVGHHMEQQPANTSINNTSTMDQSSTFSKNMLTGGTEQGPVATTIHKVPGTKNDDDDDVDFTNSGTAGGRSPSASTTATTTTTITTQVTNAATAAAAAVGTAMSSPSLSSFQASTDSNSNNNNNNNFLNSLLEDKELNATLLNTILVADDDHHDNNNNDDDHQNYDTNIAITRMGEIAMTPKNSIFNDINMNKNNNHQSSKNERRMKTTKGVNSKEQQQQQRDDDDNDMEGNYSSVIVPEIVLQPTEVARLKNTNFDDEDGIIEEYMNIDDDNDDDDDDDDDSDYDDNDVTTKNRSNNNNNNSNPPKTIEEMAIAIGINFAMKDNRTFLRTFQDQRICKKFLVLTSNVKYKDNGYMIEKVYFGTLSLPCRNMDCTMYRTMMAIRKHLIMQKQSRHDTFMSDISNLIPN